MNDDMFHPDDYQYVTRSTAGRPRASSEGVFRFTEVDDLQATLDEWSSQQSRPEFNPIQTLTVLAEMMETASDNFLKMDPDPLDDRHPVRTHPHAPYGNLLKALFKRDEFMNKLVISYLSNRDNVEVCIAAARILLSCVPGLDSEVVFSEPEDFVPRLFDWAKNSENETLQAYSMGLLSSALEVQDNASKYRNLNAQLITIALRRLHELKDRMVAERQLESNTTTTANSPYPCSPGPFSGIDLNDDPILRSSEAKNDETIIYKDMEGPNEPTIGLGGSTQPIRIRPKSQSEIPGSPPMKKMKQMSSFGSLQDLESSNSCWSRLQPYVIGKHKVYPLTLEMHQRLILQFLGPTGEYQDLLSLALEGKSMDLILYYINLENTRDVRFTFDALRYLTSLLVHRKFAFEFVARGGVQLLLKVPRLCMASVGVITCLYYLSYNEEVMEKVCQLDGAVLDELVNYALWCIEHSYESGMASAAMFFTHGFFYKAILQRFDQRDGLRKLYNYISTLGILLDPQISEGLSDEMLHTSVQSVRNASASFRSYIEAHMYVKLEQLKKVCKGLTQLLKMPTETLPQYKMMDLKEEPYDLAVEILTAMLKVFPSGWKVVEAARELGLIKTMLSIIENLMDWNAGSGRNEMVRNALEVLFLCTALPKVREDLCEVSANSKFIGYKILLNIGEGDWYEEEAVQTHALKIILNCVQNNHINKGSLRLDTKKSKLMNTELSETDKKVWICLRNYNIIMILNNVVRQTTPILEADRIRDLSCRCMFGLSRCEAIRQIFSLLPLIANNELQGFMKMPVAPDKKSEHTRFCQSAKELIEAVTQRPINDRIPDPRDLTQERLWKSYVVSNTHITYNEKELLQLIHGHLVKKGLGRTAAELIKEAELPDVPASRLMTPAKLQPLPSVTFSSSDETASPSASLYSNANTPKRPAPSKTPISRRLVFKTPGTAKTIFSQGATKKIQPFKGLDGIVTDYFRQQHTNCANPVATCPPFSLFFPHQCPEPRPYDNVSYNIVKRFSERIIRRPHDLRRSIFQDEKYAFSRFRPAKSFPEQEEMYTSCAFSVDDEHLIVGMFNGDVYWINIETGNEDSHTVCHASGVTAIEPSGDGSMLLTSSSFIRPLSALWRLRETQEHCYDFADEHKVKFSNLNLDKVVGTADHSGKTTVYDTETGRLICLYQWNKEYSTRYRQNAASFSPDDTLILNDGLVWDVRDSAKPIHVLDKMNPINGGVFHPHGNEIIVNSEVWDIRTFRLLHTVPALNLCDVKFNSTGNIIYGTTYLEDDGHHTFAASFRTFDSKDYSVITTVNTKRNLLALACSHSDHQLAVIERKTERDFLDTESSTVRLFDIGRKRDAEDDLDEGEEDNDDGDNRGNEHDDDDDDSDSVSSDSLDGEDIGVFDALHNFERGSSSESSMTDEEAEDEEDHGETDFDDDSEGWETASGEHNNENNDGPDHVDMPESDEEDPHDHSFEPQEEMEHPSTSTVALNPQIRRQKRRHNDTGGNN